MNQTDLISALKKSYKAVEPVGKNVIKVYTTDNTKQELLLIAKGFPKSRYLAQKTGPGWKSSAGAVVVDGVYILCKPAAAEGVTGSLTQLSANKFIGLAKLGTFSYHGKPVAVATFTDAKKLEASLIKGCLETKFLGKAVAETLEDFFHTGTLTWPKGFPEAIINKLGVYFGELLIGWVYLAKKESKHLTNNPFTKHPKAFHLPTDPQFSGVDSFLEMSDGSYESISSKFGGGAKASFFSNIFKIGIGIRGKLKPSVFKTLCDIAGTKGWTEKEAKKVMYEYGVRQLLKLKPTDIRDSILVFEQLKAKKQGPEARLAVMRVQQDKAFMQAYPLVKQRLPYSLSPYINRKTANLLNPDKASVSTVTEILAGKDYWQANLDINPWKKGTLSFRLTNAGSAKVVFNGAKSQIEDITTNYGWLNYELQYKR